MQKSLHIDAEKCTGCLQCEMACSFENYGTFAPARSRIKVFNFHDTGRKVPYTCTQCDEARRLHACPVEAITLDKLTGAKVVNEITCAPWLQGLHHQLPLRHDQLRAGDGQGAEMRPVWRRAGLRRSLPDRRHHLCGRQLDRLGQDGGLGRQARQSTRSGIRRIECPGLGKILRVDLTAGTVKSEPLNMDRARAYIGSRGLATKYLVEEVDPKVDPLSPANKIIWATGPLTGTMASTGGRYTVVTKGSSTGAIACSNSGGYWGAEPKMAGWDMIIFEGKSPKPVYLMINDDSAELRDAAHLWGQSVWHTEETLKKQHQDPLIRVSSIGLAGENQVLFASVVNDLHRAAGRSGVGAVMGSKNLKAIAVRGTKGVGNLFDAKAFMRVTKEKKKILADNALTGQGLPAYGTQVLIPGTHLRHAGDHYQRLRIGLQRGRAVALDTAARSVKLDDGGSVGYDRLLIATGSSPATPPIPGIAGPGVHSCWTLADARAIQAKAQPGARVLQMGAGFIGCIILEALAARGVKLAVVEMGDRMVPRMMGPTAGGMIKELVPAQGCRRAHRRAGRAHRPRGLRADEGQAVRRPGARRRPGDQRHRRQAEHRLPGAQQRAPPRSAC